MSPNKDKIPDLLGGIPWWYPGAWAPPAITLSWASFLATVLGLAWLFRNETVRALFRFPFNPFWLAGLATIVVGMVAWSCRTRPGRNGPRYWAALFTLVCLVVSIWGIAAMIDGSKGGPALHAVSLAVCMGAIALLPRLIRVHPFSQLVQHVAPASLAAVAIVCLWGAHWAEATVVHEEESNLYAKIHGLLKLDTRILTAATSLAAKEQNPDLEQLQLQAGVLKNTDLTQLLPDQPDWKALRVLKSSDQMNEAWISNLNHVTAALLDPNGPQIRRPHFQMETGNTWNEDPAFLKSSGVAATYYSELGRLFRELGAAAQNEDLKEKYEASKDALDKQRQQLSGQFGQQWIAALIANEKQPDSLSSLMKRHVGSHNYSMRDINNWKNLSWSEARLLLSSNDCLPRTRDSEYIEHRQFPDPRYPGQYYNVDIRHTVHRIECYAYRPLSGGGLDILAELHLRYDCSQGSCSSHRVTFFFDVPPGGSDYQNEVIKTLKEAVRERYDVLPRDLVSYNPAHGFMLNSGGGSTAVTASQITRGNTTTIRVQIE